MIATNDTYPLNPEFPMHMNQLWLGAHHHAKAHYHWHSFYEVSCILSGHACCFANGRRYDMNTGDIAVFNKDEIHGWEMENDVELLVLTFSPNLIATGDNLFDCGYLQIFEESQDRFQNRLDARDKNTSLLRQILKDTYKEWQNDYACRNLMIKSQILHILVLLIRCFKESAYPTGHLYSQPNSGHLKDALNYIDRHYKENLTLKDAAAAACMSPNYFSGFFHKALGEKFIDYVMRLRLETAEDLLQNSTDNVLNIALASGFQNISNFYKCYRKKYGYPPRKK